MNSVHMKSPRYTDPSRTCSLPDVTASSGWRPLPERLAALVGALFLLWSGSLVWAQGSSARVDVIEEIPDRTYLDPELTRLIDTRSEFLIAILPVENHTVDPEVAYVLRTELAQRLVAKGYTVRELQSVDRLLNEFGVSHVGQLGLLPFSELAAQLAVDGVLSAVVEQSAVQRAALYNAFVYTISVKLQDGNSGQLLWSALSERAAKRRFALDPVNAIIDIALIDHERGADAMAYLARKTLHGLPDGPLEVSITDPLLDRARPIEVSPPQGEPE